MAIENGADQDWTLHWLFFPVRSNVRVMRHHREFSETIYTSSSALEGYIWITFTLRFMHVLLFCLRVHHNNIRPTEV